MPPKKSVRPYRYPRAGPWNRPGSTLSGFLRTAHTVLIPDWKPSAQASDAVPSSVAAHTRLVPGEPAGDLLTERGSPARGSRVRPLFQPALSHELHNTSVKIMVVDDEPAVRESLRRALQLEGYEVALAGDGAEALERLEDHEEEPDALILDVAMPEVDGLSVCRRL